MQTCSKEVMTPSIDYAMNCEFMLLMTSRTNYGQKRNTNIQ